MDDITRLPAAGHTDLFVVTGARAASDQTDLDKQLMFDRTHRTLWLAAVVSVAVMIQTQNTHAADWPQLQGNPGHTGYTSDEPKPPYALKWIRQLKQPTHPGVPPIVAKGKVFLGTAWGNLLALDGNTGETTWTFKTGSAICGTPVFDQGLVYVTSMDRFCYAVNAETGKQVWAFETFEGIWAGPVVAEGKVFVAGRDAKVHAVNAETGSACGRRLWEQWSWPRQPTMMACSMWELATTASTPWMPQRVDNCGSRTSFPAWPSATTGWWLVMVW